MKPMETAVSMVWILPQTNSSQIGFTEPMENTENRNSQKNEMMVNINTMKKSSNFLKSLDIAAIINEIELFHPSTHEFGKRKE